MNDNIITEERYTSFLLARLDYEGSEFFPRFVVFDPKAAGGARLERERSWLVRLDLLFEIVAVHVDLNPPLGSHPKRHLITLSCLRHSYS